MDMPADGSGDGLDGLDPPTPSDFIADAASQDMIMDDFVVETEPVEHKSKCGVSATSSGGDSGGEVMTCARCDMPGSDLRLLPCNCTLHVVSRIATLDLGRIFFWRSDLSRRLDSLLQAKTRRGIS